MSKTHFPGLSTKAFSHQLDVSSFEALSHTPLISHFINNMIKFLAEVPVFVEMYSNAVRVTPKNYGKIHDLMMEACQILDMSPPDLFVKHDFNSNAFTTGIENPAIILFSGLVDTLNEAELQSVIAHELGHIKARHIFYHQIVRVVATYGSGFAGKFFPAHLAQQGFLALFMSHLRKCELTADRASLLVAQDPHVIISTCMKLAGGCTNPEHELSTNEFLVQGKSLEGLIYDNNYAGLLYWLKTIGRTHPLPVPRASIIHAYSESQEYHNILEGNYKQYDLKVCMNCKKATSILNKVCPHCMAQFGKQMLSDLIYCRVCDNAIQKSEYDLGEMRFCPDCGSDMMGKENIFNKYEWI